MMLFRISVCVFAALHFLLVKGQATHTVVVGLQGSFYNPPSISAGINDTVIFEFVGDIHTVTQSTFDNPCTPLPGGFNSGVAGTGTNNSAPPPTWNLVVTNVSEPLWFFCEITLPMSHCASGMVGVINPPSIAMYDQFVSAAKLVTGTPAPVATVILTGQGAFATGPPTTLPVSITPRPSSSSTTISNSTSSTPTSTSAPTVTASTHNLGAIVGGAVAGGVVGICLAILTWLFLRKRKAPATRESESDDFFRYNPVPHRRPSELFDEAKRAEDLRHNRSFTSNDTSNRALSPAADLSPLRRPPTQTQPVILQPPAIRRQISTESDHLSSNSSPTATTGNTLLNQRPTNVDIRNLAQEVAAVLYQNSPVHHKDSSSQDLRQMAIQNQDDIDSVSPKTQPPPNYRTATTLVPRAMPRNV